MLARRQLTRYTRILKRNSWNRSLHIWHLWDHLLIGEMTGGTTEMTIDEEVRKGAQVCLKIIVEMMSILGCSNLATYDPLHDVSLRKISQGSIYEQMGAPNMKRLKFFVFVLCQYYIFLYCDSLYGKVVDLNLPSLHA